ncbi:PAS domain-containing protein, partial [Zavarzinella formosa]|uniref:PAS domain-containing protein n=1 Tax=Zavarzinella formosa TaxID=360055 RepID=UPI00187DAD05
MTNLSNEYSDERPSADSPIPGDEAIRQSEERYRALVKATGQIVWSWSPDGAKTDFTQTQQWWEEITGQTLADQRRSGTAWLDVVHPDDREAAGAAWDISLSTGNLYDVTYRVRSREGGWRHVHARGVPIPGTDGTPREWVGTLNDVTDRRRAEDDNTRLLREVEAERNRLADVFRHAPSFMGVLMGPEHRFVLTNDGYLDLLGGRNVIGLTVREAHPEMGGQGYFDILDQVFWSGEPYVGENERVVLDRGGTLEERALDFVYQPLRDATGAVSGIIVQGIDFTERRRAEDDLRDIRSRMEAALAAGAIGTWTWDVPNDRYYGDASLARIFSVSPEAVAGGPLAGLIVSIHPDDKVRVEDLVRRALDAGGRYEAEYRVSDGAGGWRWVNARGQVELDGAGKAVRFPGVVIEVTDQKRAEEALARVTAEAERRTRLYEAVLSTTPDLAYVWGLDHRFAFANDGLLRMWGKTWDEAVGKNCLELGYEPWHAEMHDREIDEVIATKKPVRGEVPFAGTFGRRMYDYILMPVLGADGEVEAVAGVTRDVTERKRHEESLRQSEELLRLATDAAELGVWVWDVAEDRVTWENDRPYEIFGLDPSSGPVNAARFRDEFVHPDDAEAFGSAVERAVRTGDRFYFQGRLRR